MTSIGSRQIHDLSRRGGLHPQSITGKSFQPLRAQSFLQLRTETIISLFQIANFTCKPSTLVSFHSGVDRCQKEYSQKKRRECKANRSKQTFIQLLHLLTLSRPHEASRCGSVDCYLSLPRSEESAYVKRFSTFF